MVAILKEVEWKLVCELMKNSRRSDRDLAKALKVSQPTVTRTRTKLEKEGIVKEYTMIPDFAKLGFEIMSIEFATTKEPFSEEKLKEIRKELHQTLWKEPMSLIIGMSGSGLNADKVTVAFHEDYPTYVKHHSKVTAHPYAIPNQTQSFLIDVTDKNQYLPLTLSRLADYIAYKKCPKEKRQQGKGEP
jgi:DNA-binding Lrp family transcriptional regulator